LRAAAASAAAFRHVQYRHCWRALSLSTGGSHAPWWPTDRAVMKRLQPAVERRRRRGLYPCG